MSGINGFYEIANRHPQFDGIETEVVEEQGKLIKAVARVYRKDRGRPMTAEAFNSEYNKGYGNWKNMPRVMLSKCAEAMALRKSFPQDLSGLYTSEEMPQEFSAASAGGEQPRAKQPQVIVADELPGNSEAFQASAEPAVERPLNYYDLTGFPVEKLTKLVKNLIAIGAQQVSETTWATPKRIKSLEGYIVKEPVNVEGVAA